MCSINFLLIYSLTWDSTDFLPGSCLLYTLVHDGNNFFEIKPNELLCFYFFSIYADDTE